jgi:hypothetical protein
MRDQEPRASSWMRLAEDVRQAIRTLRRAPVFTVVALLTLTIGVGANTAIFSLVNVLVLRDLPASQPTFTSSFFLRNRTAFWRNCERVTFPGDIGHQTPQEQLSR